MSVIEIQLRGRSGKGRVALVDAGDLPLLQNLTWYCSGGYARSRAGGAMHRLILGLTSDDGREVDHINHNRLDNRRCNLRVVTAAQNQQNRKGCNRGCASGVRGVYVEPVTGKWVARVKGHYGGVHTSIESAARAAAALRAKLGYIDCEVPR